MSSTHFEGSNEKLTPRQAQARGMYPLTPKQARAQGIPFEKQKSREPKTGADGEYDFSVTGEVLGDEPVFKQLHELPHDGDGNKNNPPERVH